MFEYRCNLDRVVDGDTVDLIVDLGFHVSINIRVRLMGVMAPEVRGAEREAGRAATQQLASFLAGGNLTVQTHKGRTNDKYGRWLGIIYRGNENVNHLMTEWLDKHREGGIL